MFCFTSGTAQRDPVWYFGNRAGLTFASGVPVPLTDNVFNTYEGTTTVCDANGQLLFYSNGMRVVNRNHATMPNGSGLKGGSSSTHSALSIAHPGVPGRYYLFTAGEVASEGIYYSEIDMSAQNGLGDVVVKNVLLLAQSCEKLAAVPHPNGTDIWVLGHQWNSNAFYAWRVTAAGVSAPVISAVGTVVIGPQPYIAAAGQLKVSPDGRKLVNVNTSINTQLFDFDTQTGVVSNPLTLMTGYQFGAEFSPSSNAVYVNEASYDNSAVFQFDLQAADIVGSALQVTPGLNNLQWGMLDLAPDAKIYVATYGSNRLSVIQQPDVIGLGCTLQPLTTALAGRTTFYGLPTFYQPGFYITAVQHNGSCAGNAIVFNATTTKTPDSMYWDFGDGNFSTTWQPTHVYAQPGTYTVRVKARSQDFERYFSTTVTVLPGVTATAPATVKVCDDAGNDGLAVFDLSLWQSVVLGNQSATQHTVTFHTSQADAESGTGALPLQFQNTVNPQTLYARVTSASGCYAVASFDLHVVLKPQLHLEPVNWLCAGSAIALTVPTGFDHYLWSTGVTTPHIVVTQPGDYSVTVTHLDGNFACATMATTTVSLSSAPVITHISVRDWTDQNNSIVVTVSGSGLYEYSLDGISYQQSNTFTDLLPGKYEVFVRDVHGCGEARGEAVLLMYPKYFTPNGDGIHDVWAIPNAYLEPGMRVRIFDRYGTILTSFSGDGYGWDGQFQGRMLPSTDYWFVVQRANGTEERGHFAMLR
ncbi:T9SS type B sorting domain-containing protein [Flavobacterium sp.]|uniref:T9SS type B sorting domain-containing protein n=1 Tax=Flavobacterium sp. TaxID=239 RepID=UPI002FDCE4B9